MVNAAQIGIEKLQCPTLIRNHFILVGVIGNYTKSQLSIQYVNELSVLKAVVAGAIKLCVGASSAPRSSFLNLTLKSICHLRSHSGVFQGSCHSLLKF